MRLSKIKLAGFKSFVDPTTIPLPGNLTGIVGPNGCGKSNTIDAVRWVMGESSAKNLRGDSMTDVIFNGSSSRKPVGQASIELIFDNSDATLGGQWATYAEIALKRVVTRDGGSSYYLNNARCRRRDITDIFLGTGLGPRSYAIIEQGTISRLIEARPEELRVFLEEAAGISKYKERRRETENRMRHTRENLDRLNDLREELEKQLAHLQRQARTAERFKELKAEERQFRGQMLALRWQGLDRDTNTREAAIREFAVQLEAEISRQRAAEAEIERLREAHGEATESFNRVQGDFYGVGADIARLEQGIQHARERRSQQRGDLAQLERTFNEAQHLSESDQARIDQLRQLLAEGEPAHAAAEEAVALSAATLAEAEEAMHDWQGRWDDLSQRAAEPSRVAHSEQARLQQLEQQQLQLSQRLLRFKEEQRQLETGPLEEEIALLVEQLAEAELTSAEQQEALDQLIQRLMAQRETNGQLATELDRLRTQLQHHRGRHASLEALQQAALGKRPGAVSAFLEQHGLADAQRLAQGLTVEAGWERAVETVLGDHLEAVCVAGLDPVVELLAGLEHGTLTLFDTDPTTPPLAAAELANPLASRVTANWPLASLLAGVYGVEGLAEALALRPRLAGHESVITRDGLWLGPNWLRLARDADEHAGVLHREQELRELGDAIATLEAEVSNTASAVEEGRSQLKQLEEGREGGQRRVNEAQRAVGERKAQLTGKQARLDQLRQRRDRLLHDIEEAERQHDQLSEEIEISRERLAEALLLMEELAELREQLSGEREDRREELEQARRQSRSEREALHALALRIQGARTELTATEQGRERVALQLEELAERRELLAVALEEGAAPLAEMEEELAEQLERRSAVELRLTEARRKVGEVDHTIRQQEQQRATAERQAQEVRAKVEEAKLRWQELSVRRQTVLEQLTEAEQSLPELLAELPEGANEKAWETRLEELATRIARLGPINLAAIDEYEQQAERKHYLDAQHGDLTEALETLEEAIRKIDRETRTRFKETFDRVNSGLQEKFPRLFGGGHAYLELTGEDLLDTGVTVMARPPGKRNSTIHLLSGGEKALTAVAMVFAIFELNPSPFCMLDEVDAPLDEANVGRFCDLVRQMSERVQFIFITHNKATMELANNLIGVTMHEPGVSRIVAVDVEEAVELAAVGG